MGKNDLLIYGVLAVGAYIFYSRMGGKQMIDDLLGDLKGGGGGGINLGGSSGGSFTDDKGNNISINGKGKICIANRCYEGSGQDIQHNNQSNIGSGGSIIQKQSRNQKSTSFFTMPNRFGNL